MRIKVDNNDLLMVVSVVLIITSIAAWQLQDRVKSLEARVAECEPSSILLP